MTPKKSRRGNVEGAVVATLRHVGLTDKERLTWLVGAVQKRFEDMPPGERADLRLAVWIYANKDPHPGWETELALESWAGKDEDDLMADQRKQTDDEVKDNLSYLEGILRAAVRRERMTKPSRVRAEYLTWGEGLQRFYIGHDYGVRTWKEAARIALWRQLVACGHLLKECPAPAKRGKPGEVCGILFIAKRPNQDFCSSTCRSRAGVREVRARARNAMMVTPSASSTRRSRPA